MSASDNVAAMSLVYSTSIKGLQDSLNDYKELIKKTEVIFVLILGRIERDE